MDAEVCPACDGRGFVLGQYQDAKSLLQQWVDKRGHDRCWYYPEIFNQLCVALDVEVKAPELPTRSEFETGCRRYQDEQPFPADS